MVKVTGVVAKKKKVAQKEVKPGALADGWKEFLHMNRIMKRERLRGTTGHVMTAEQVIDSVCGDHARMVAGF